MYSPGRLFLTLLISFSTVIVGLGQIHPYGNEWIIPGQEYFKISTFQTGLYKLSYQELAGAGIPLTSIDPSTVQLFHRGEEVAIRITGEEDGTFDLSDTLVFWGKRNDGTLDSLLYKPNSAHSNKYLNLFSDTTAYFLTWGASGKRMESTSFTGALSISDVTYKKELLLLKETYTPGEHWSSSRLSSFGKAEGWSSSYIGKSPTAAFVTKTFSVPVENHSPLGKGYLGILINGYIPQEHTVEVILGNLSSPDTVYQVPVFSGFDHQKFMAEFPSDIITGSNVTVTAKLLGASGAWDYISVPYVKIYYRSAADMLSKTNLSIWRKNALTDESIRISNVPAGTIIYDVSDANNVKIVAPSDTVGADLTVPVPAGSEHLHAASPSAFLSPKSVKRVNLFNLSHTSQSVIKAQFIIITHPKLYQATKAYGAYRAGTGYDTLIALTSDIFNQFSYGEETPAAIHNFCRYLADLGDPQYLFLIGKALNVNYSNPRIGKLYRWFPQAYTSLDPSSYDNVENLVPTGGLPTSDLIYTMGKGGAGEYVPAFPVGRLHAKNEADVYAYLEKVIQHENLSDTLLWRKHVLHLSGGTSETEIENFKKRMELLEPMVEDSVFGGRVIKHIVKTPGNYVDDELIETVSEEVNKGVSYVTFLGHAAPTSIDIDVGFVSNKLYGYNNDGKYPLLILNGCNVVGASAPKTLAEDWLQTPKKGAIAAMGHSDLGYSGLLEIYTKKLYRNLFNRRLAYEQNLALGDVQKLTIIDQINNNTVYNLSMMEQYLLQGDPSIRIYVPEKPDFAISTVTVNALDQLPVTATSDSFALKIVIPDYGITTPDSIKITVSRTVGTEVFHYDTLIHKSVFYEDTIVFIIKTNGNKAFGMNSFTVTVDPQNEIEELNEVNNIYTFQYFVPANIILPVFPKEFNIVSSQPVSLSAQATDILLTERSYYLEIDTSYSFNSPFKKSTIITAGGLVRWENIDLIPDSPESDSIVYFWRVRFNEVPLSEDTVWGESSFTYIKEGPEGWSQSKFAEFRKNSFVNFDYNLSAEEINFPGIQIYLNADSPGNQYIGPDPSKNSTHWANLGLNGDPIIYENRGGCGTGIYAITFDKSTILPYFPVPELPKCGRTNSSKRINSFTNLGNTSLTAPRGQGDLIKYLEAVKPGDYVLLMSVGDARMDVWLDTLKNQIEAVLGAEYLDSLQREMPYIILARKGATAPIFEHYSSVDDIISLDYTLEGKLNQGVITSTTIGPASSWSTLFKEIHEEPEDSVINGIIGIRYTGVKDTLFYGAIADTFDLSSIDPVIYPYISLFAHLIDSTFQTPAKIKKWQVLYGGVPEGTIDPHKLGLENYAAIVKQEGEDVSLDFNFYNISTKDFSDSLKVKFSIIETSSGKSVVDWFNIPKLPADSGADFNYSFNTKGYSGSYLLQLYVNPQLQPEMLYHNNILEIPLTVKEDKINPVLDVTFDGIHILDGDIVSPNPLIVISLRDENPFLIVNDTTGMELYLKGPCTGCDFESVNFSDPSVLNWGLSSANNNNFRIEFNPKNLPDGIYTLLVQGSDASGNKSGMEAYKISFEVVNELSVSNFYPYPNPFSTNTRFVFTLTGNKVPDDLKIQIMTVAGKVVREIRKEELGPVHIGNNISDYAWDGTDQFGDRLANGVYLYRVIIKDSEEFLHRKTSGDKAFHKSFGKLYILR